MSTTEKYDIISLHASLHYAAVTAFAAPYFELKLLFHELYFRGNHALQYLRLPYMRNICIQSQRNNLPRSPPTRFRTDFRNVTALHAGSATGQPKLVLNKVIHTARTMAKGILQSVCGFKKVFFLACSTSYSCCHPLRSWRSMQ